MEKTPTSIPLTNVISSPSPGPPRVPLAPPLYRSPGPPPTTFTPQAHRPPNQTPSSASSLGSQFSTPPGPPVFSSPLQPSIPFHATPSPPHQAPIFTPGSSSLPTSSPAHFTNGSTELPLRYPAGSDDSGPESPYVLFSAQKVLKRKKVANVPSLGFGAIVSPGLEIASGLEVVERDPYRCQNCGAYSNLYCQVLIGSGQWQCAICKNLNSSEGSYICNTREELLSWPELSLSAVDYVSGNRRPGFVPVPEARSTSPIFLLIDECLDEVHLTHLQGSLHAFVDSLPPTTRVGIITYGRTISVYDFSEGSVVSADTVPGDNSPSQDLFKPLIYGTGLYISPMHASLPVAHSIFSSLRPYKLNEPEVSRDRCLGAAVEVALGLVRGPTAESSRGIIRRSGGNFRILVCAGGPCTYGPGSVPSSVNHPNYAYLEKSSIKYMEKLGHEARRYGAVVDLLCAGNCPVRVPVLQPLAKSSGGVLILHDDFGEAFGVNLQRASARASGSNGGLFEIRCSNDILVTQVIGPGEEAAPDSHETFKKDTSFYIQMHSVEETQSFAISMETKGDIKSDFICFQFSVRYSTPYLSDVTRVITVRLPTVDSVSAYLSSVNDDVAAVLIAKQTVLHASTSAEAANMRYQIDERVKDMAYNFGSQMPKSKMYQFPKELQFLPELLFHLRRGPLLGGIIGHEDERSVLRNLFLNASLDLSLRMVGPRCLMHKEGGTFEELPAYDLAMQSNAAVVLDHGTDIFIWLGAELAGQEGKSAAALAACRTLAEELSETRFPAPRILSFKEGSSQARYFVSRLIPAHKDPTYEQEARFPQLKTLSQDQRSRLKSSFLPFDDYSFCEWMRSLKLIPPEPS